MARRPLQSSLFTEDPRDSWYFERRAHQRNFRRIAGVDEAGRGPLAGPVVAAAVVLPYGIDLPNRPRFKTTQSFAAPSLL